MSDYSIIGSFSCIACPLLMIFLTLVVVVILMITMFKNAAKEKRDVDNIIKDDFKGIDSISDDELEYFANDPSRKMEVDEILHKEPDGSYSRTKEIRMPFWFKYMGPAKKVCFISSVLFILHIPLSVIGTFLLFFLGLIIDGSLYNPGPNTLGHPAAVFCALFPLIGIYVFIIIAFAILLVVLISFIVSMIIKEK